MEGQENIVVMDNYTVNGINCCILILPNSADENDIFHRREAEARRNVFPAPPRLCGEKMQGFIPFTV
jgi:hypothetical protein